MQELPATTYLVVALVAVVFAASVLHARRRGGARDRAIRGLAVRRGWRYHATDPAGVGDLRFRSFADARHAVVTNVVSASTGAGDVRVFDYSLLFEREGYDRRGDLMVGLADDLFGAESSSGRHTTRSYTGRRSAGVVRVDAFLPPLTATPATLWSRAAERAGVPDRDFESLEFNRHWDVRCGDERFAWLFCDASMIDLVLELGRGVTVETFGNYVLVARELLDETEVEHFVDVLTRLPRAMNPLLPAEYPTVAAMEEQRMAEAWRDRPDGRGGVF